MNGVRLFWRLAGVAVAILLALGLRLSTVLPWRGPGGDAARVRLSWSGRPERIEQCRRLTDEELAKLPQHMRLRTKCDGHLASYLLAVTIDGQLMLSDTLRGGGLRHDRPIHLFTELEALPGERRVHVEIRRLTAITDDRASADTSPAEPRDTLLGSRAAREDEERARRTAEAMPPQMVLDTVVTIAARRVLLVWYDDRERRLFARTGD
jgi:hypothetical protein